MKNSQLKQEIVELKEEETLNLDLDSTTDIFKAKDILGDHMCIMGDVPASLFALGTAEEVEAYCRKFID